MLVDMLSLFSGMTNMWPLKQQVAVGLSVKLYCNHYRIEKLLLLSFEDIYYI